MDFESLLTRRQRRTIQSNLRSLGFYKQELDGSFGEGSRAAIRAYQKDIGERSEEHTSELQSLMRISYAVFCLKKKTTKKIHSHHRERADDNKRQNKEKR